MTREEINERINALYTEKMNLEASLIGDDYKIIKCAEAQSVGEELPYDAEALHRQRQAWRDRINAIEDKIAKLEAMGPEDQPAQGSGTSSEGVENDNGGENGGNGGSGDGGGVE